jgi:TolB-like protein
MQRRGGGQVFLNRLVLGISVVYLCLLLGCASQPTPVGVAYDDGNLVAVAYTIADKLAEAPWFVELIGSTDPLIVASFVNVNDLQESSSFGRILAEQISSRLAQRGHKVIELKLRQESIFIREGHGELLLSRDIQELSKTYNVAAVVVGTYAEGVDRLFVSARSLRPADNLIISSYDVGIVMHPVAMSILLNREHIRWDYPLFEQSTWR